MRRGLLFLAAASALSIPAELAIKEAAKLSSAMEALTAWSSAIGKSAAESPLTGHLYEEFLRAAAVFLLFFLASTAVALVGLLAYYGRGLKALAATWPPARLPSRGVLLAAVGLIVAVISMFLGNAPLYVLSSLTSFVGQILAFVLAAFRLGRYFDSDTLTAAGLAYIVALLIPITYFMANLAPAASLASLAADLLMYVGLKRAQRQAPYEVSTT